MHYQHRYHAGNFADVFKHALLCELLAALNRKEAPWFYLETHAGAGIYDLSRDEAARTAEFEGGIARLWDLRDQDSPIGNYLRLIGALNPDGELRHYPGSPLVAQKLARDSDRLALCEKVPEVAASLKQSLGRDARVAVHARDGYEAYALLPLPQKRGLVLIDPPFERELDRPLLRVELDTDAHAEGQMRACGMLVVNPPFGFDERARGIMKLLARKLAQGPRPQWSVA